MEAFLESSTVLNGDYIEFPILYNSKKPAYTWQIYASIRKKTPISETIIPFKKEYIENPPVTNNLESKVDSNETISVLYYTKYGMLKKQVKITEVNAGKNIGKKNATNFVSQAFTEIFSLYTKKISSGYVKDVKEINTEITMESLYEKGKLMLYPMNLQRLAPNIKKLKFPVLCQRKFNGITGNYVQYKDFDQIWTRLRNPLKRGVDHIKKELKTLEQERYFVGELYCENCSLQKIVGLCRKDEENKDLQFYIFDSYKINDKTSAIERDKYLQNLKTLHNFTYVKFITSDIANSFDEIKTLEKQYVDEGFEGIVVRLSDKPYEYSVTQAIRSFNIYKSKLVLEDDFPIINYICDDDKRIIFICQQLIKSDNAPLLFHVVPTWSDSERKLAYINIQKNNDYIGQYAKVYYNGLSDNGVPQQAKMSSIVDEDYLYFLLHA